jgi:heat shock protein HslJ/uncharacterized membrane protein
VRRTLIVAALCASAAGAREPAGETYRAFGSDPPWSLTIAHDRMTLTRPGARPVSTRTPIRGEDELGWEYRTRTLVVQGLKGSCEDESAGRRFAEMVAVTVGGRELIGCGGAEIPAGSLADTSWMIREIAGSPVQSPQLSIDFHPTGSFLAYTGCRRIGGTYAQTGEQLVMTPTGATTGRCAEPAHGCELRLLEILTQPMTVSFPERRTLLLSGAKGAIKLRNPAKDEDIFQTSFAPCPVSP